MADHSNESEKDHEKDDDQEIAHDSSSRVSHASISLTPDSVATLSHQDIVYHYLNFETPLPTPAYLHTSPVGSPSCSSPNLKQYTSPFLWSNTRKRLMTYLACVSTIAAAYTAGSYAPGEAQMMAEWNISKPVASVGITVFTAGFGIGPMFLAPFSEINGRRPVFVASGILFVVFQLTCALTPTFAGELIARFLTGIVSSTFSTIGGGVISDVYKAVNRNTAMSLFAGSAMFGTGLGPLISAFIAENTTWRWVRKIFYLQTIGCGVLILVMTACFKETRGSVLLSRKAKALNKWYEALESEGFYGVMMETAMNHSQDSQESGKTLQRIRWKVQADEERANVAVMIYTSVSRPFLLLFTEPITFFISLWAAFAWAVLYLLFSAIPLVFQTSHEFTLAQANAVFAAVSIASIVITAVSIVQDKLARKYAPPKIQAMFNTPEGRLFFCCAECVLLPVGCFWFGWTSFPSVPWIVPALAVGCVTMGIFSVYLTVFNYLADAYGRYASSALAAQSLCRNLLAGVFPVIVPPMFNALTFQGAGSLLGGIAALLTLVPWTLAVFGPRIRARSKVCREVMEPR